MTRHVRLGEYLVGVEGIALMRHLFEDDGPAAKRVEEIRRIVCGRDDVYQLGADVPILDFRSGYDRWSQTYDNPGNPLIHLEQTVVWSIFETITPACRVQGHAGRDRLQD